MTLVPMQLGGRGRAELYRPAGQPMLFASSSGSVNFLAPQALLQILFLMEKSSVQIGSGWGPGDPPSPAPPPLLMTSLRSPWNMVEQLDSHAVHTGHFTGFTLLIITFLFSKELFLHKNM